MKTSFRFALLTSVLALAACGGGSVTAGDADGENVDALSSVTSAMVTIRPDMRKCASPMCGGYWVAQANRTVAEIYVSGLDFSQSNLGDADIARVTSAPASELLLSAKLSRKDAATGQKTLIVLDAYRGMPGRTAQATDKFYAVTNEAKSCFAAPCNQFSAHKLNSTALPKGITTVSVASAATGFVDEAWLTHRVTANGAIVTASIVNGEKYAAGYEKVLDASQVYLHLPEDVGPCPALMALNCGASGKVNIYERNENRCQVPAGCATAGVCAMMMPACPEGYSLTSYRGGTNACPRYTCDPTWVVQQ